MARPLRIEFAGALYHITSRGNARAAISFDKVDRLKFLELLAQCVDRYAWQCHAYCLMDNHYHLIIETGKPTLSRGMQYLNGSYSQAFNRRHNRVGHVFQGRYEAILVQAESYLLELCRYVVLNPVRAKMTHIAEEWPWSSYQATAGLVPSPDWLERDKVLSLFGNDNGLAVSAYQEFVSLGNAQPSPWKHLHNQIYLGSEGFINETQRKIAGTARLRGIPQIQTGPVKHHIDWYFSHCASRDSAVVMAYRSGHFTQQEIGDFLQLSHTTISRIVRSFDVQMET